jgi:hypothetical protein
MGGYMKKLTWVLIVASTVSLAGCSMIAGLFGGSSDDTKNPGGSNTPQVVERPFIDEAATGTKICYRGQSVAILSATIGAKIYYTIDASEPSSASTLYSIPIYVKKTTTIKALATKSGMTDSPVSTVTFSLDQGPLETVSLDDAAVNFSLSSTSPMVSLSSSEAMTRVRYVFQGNDSASPLPLVVVDNFSGTPSTTSVVSLGMNANFPNGEWELREIRLDTATSEHLYLYAQGGSDDQNLRADYDHSSRTIGASEWAGMGTAVYLDGGKPSVTISNAAASDTDAPTVSAVAVSGTGSGLAGAFLPGDRLTITVTTSEATALANLTVLLRPKDQDFQSWVGSGQGVGSITDENRNFYGFLEGIATTGANVYEATVVLEDNGFPFDLYPVVTVDDIWRNEATYYCDAAKADPTKYSVDARGNHLGYASTRTSQDEDMCPQGNVDIPSIPFDSTAFAAAKESLANPDGAWHDFAIAPGGFDVFAYTIASGTRYYFQTNDGNGGGGTNSATGMKYCLLNADYSWESYGPTGDYNDALNAHPFIASQSGKLYVIARMNVNGTSGSTAAHHLTTTAPTTP